MNKIFKAGIFIVASILILSACKAPRTVMKAPLKQAGPQYLYEKLKEHEVHADWISIKFNATYYEKKNYTDFKGQIRIKQDSLIWITVTPALGIEMFRMLITNDSVIVF